MTTQTLTLTLFISSILAITPVASLPHNHNTHHHHQVRDTAKTKTSMPDWQIALLGIGCILAVTSLGLIGGACQGIFCTSRKKKLNDDDDTAGAAAPSTHQQQQQGLDFGCRGYEASDGASDQSTLAASRFSWQDEKGVTTEVYMDGAVPGAGPPPPQPIFMISDEQDDEEYQREQMAAAAAHMQQQAGYFQPPMAASHGVVGASAPPRSPLSPAWGRSPSPLLESSFGGGVGGGTPASGGGLARQNGCERNGAAREETEHWMADVDLEDEPLRGGEKAAAANAQAEGKWHPTQFL